jgi:hypothetical protein
MPTTWRVCGYQISLAHDALGIDGRSGSFKA